MTTVDNISGLAGTCLVKFEWYVAHQVPFADPQSFIGLAAKAGLCDNQDFWACTFTPNPLHDL
jgi:hypothetical protein